MKHSILKSIRAACLAPLSGLFLMSAVEAQTAMPAASSAHMPNMSQGAVQRGEGNPHDMKQSMMNGMESMHQMPLTGDTDKDFAMMMKMHHQQALKMAKVEIDHGKSPQLKAMAKKMVKDQTKEIGQLDQWLKSNP